MKISGDIFEVRIGNVGTGKTLSQTELVVLPALKSGLQVYCNYFVNWSGDNFHLFTSFEDIINVRNCVVVFDEIQQVLDPRAWDNESNDVRRWFQQHRKYHIDIYGTTQHISLIAKSALIIVDRFIICDRVWNGSFLELIKFPYIVIQETDMTLNEIRMEEKAFLFDLDDDEASFSMGESHNHWFSKKGLLHPELDEYKLEYYHYYCSLCNSSHSPSINKLVSYEDALCNAPQCPKHASVTLDVKDSPMYDTNFVVAPVVRYHKYIAVTPCPSGCGKNILYKGGFTPEELVAKYELEKKEKI